MQKEFGKEKTDFFFSHPSYWYFLLILRKVEIPFHTSPKVEEKHEKLREQLGIWSWKKSKIYSLTPYLNRQKRKSKCIYLSTISCSYYRVFIKYCVFSEFFKIFRTLFSLGVSLCTQSRQVENQKNHNFKEKTQYLMNTLYDSVWCDLFSFFLRWRC